MFPWVKSNELSSKKINKSSSLLQGKGPQLPTIPSKKETQGAHAAPVPVEKGPSEFFSFYMLNFVITLVDQIGLVSETLKNCVRFFSG